MKISIDIETVYNIGELVLAKDGNGNPISNYKVLGAEIQLDSPIVYKITEIVVMSASMEYLYQVQYYRVTPTGELANLFQQGYLREWQIHSTWIQK